MQDYDGLFHSFNPIYLAQESASLAKQGYDSTGKAIHTVGDTVESGWDHTKSGTVTVGEHRFIMFTFQRGFEIFFNPNEFNNFSA